jgi:hypothetical protein
MVLFDAAQKLAYSECQPEYVHFKVSCQHVSTIRTRALPLADAISVGALRVLRH